MFDFGIGTTELLMIAMIALIVVGPKDLPKLLKTIGKYVGKIKTMAREFQGHVEDAARETGVDEIKKDFSEAADYDIDEDFKQQEAELSKVFETSALEPDEPPSAKTAGRKSPATTKVVKKKTVKKVAAKKPAKKPAKNAAKKAAAKAAKKG